MATKVAINVEKQPGNKSFACYMVDEMEEFGLSGYGKTVSEAIEDLKLTEKETREMMKDNGKEMPELEFVYHFDIGSLFDYYCYLNIAGVAKKIGINASLLRQYASGIHKPSENRRQLIMSTVKKMGNELLNLSI